MPEQTMLTQQKQKTEVIFLVDQSGSMSSIQKETVEGFNEHVQTIRKKSIGNLETKVSLVFFSDSEVHTHFWRQDVQQLKELAEADYNPNGNTPLCEAMFNVFERLGEELGSNLGDANTAFLILIFSDGRENASDSSKRKQLPKLVKKFEDTGRATLVYIGSEGLNLEEIATRDVHFAGASSYVRAMKMNTPALAGNSYSVSSHHVGQYMDQRKHGLMASVNYFGDKDGGESDPQSVLGSSKLTHLGKGPKGTSDQSKTSGNLP